MKVESLVTMLNGKPQGKGYIACCPAHNDKHPSLSISEVSGKILLKCWTGCSVESIVSAIGIETKDLFPESSLTSVQRKKYKRIKNLSELWSALYREMHVLLQIVNNRVCDESLLKDKNFKECRSEFRPLPPEFWDREMLAAKRVKRIIGDIYEL